MDLILCADSFYEFVEDLEIELSTYCNAKCPLCYRNHINFKSHYPKNFERDYDDLIKQLKRFKNVKYIRLVGTVSEPTLYSKFLDLCKFIKTSFNWEIEICTNGDTHDTNFWYDLGKILADTDKVYFTICGSTQELHEKYRVGTSLKNILKNAESLRKARRIDYAQIIRFSYNSDDLDSEYFKKIVEPFTNKYYTETFLRLNINNYRNKQNLDLLGVNPHKKYKYNIAEKLSTLNLKSNCDCKAFNNKWGQIDVYGNLYPCYRFLEFSNGKLWDFDYSKIKKNLYDSCKFCRRDVVKFLKDNDLEYII